MVENLDATRAQAIGMSTFAEIKLTPEQINKYIENRISEKREFNTQSDHELLFPILNPNQQTIFERKFWNIKFR